MLLLKFIYLFFLLNISNLFSLPNSENKLPKIISQDRLIIKGNN